MAPVILAYDGSELAAFAIERAGIELAPGREALVACVWHPVDVGFTPVDGEPLALIGLSAGPRGTRSHFSTQPADQASVAASSGAASEPKRAV